MDQFEFNVPRFNTFNSNTDSEEEDVETYFDFDHEDDDQLNLNGAENQSRVEDKDFENATEADFVINKTPKKLTSANIPKKTPRKSEGELLSGFRELHLTTPGKIHPMETRLDSTRKSQPLELRSRKVARIGLEEGDNLDDPKEDGKKRKRSVRSDEPEKYVCMAEAVVRFHRATPARFHSKPRNEIFEWNTKVGSTKRCTIPISPHLKVLQRNRPTHALSRKQLEDLEVEEMKRFQVKARPISNRIFKPPSMDFSHRSLQLTELKPFNLTEFKKKIEEPQPTVVKFTARPVPKGLFKKGVDKNTSAPSLSSSNSYWPVRLRVPVAKSKEKENKIINKPIRKGPVTTVPFSFHDRDMMMLKKKEERMKKQLEEDKKMHEFHANPLPSFPEKPFQEKATIIPTIQQPFRLSADDKGKANKEKWEKKLEEEKMQMKKAAQFKAKPPVILGKKPFVPVKTEHECKALDFQLNTEIRSKERALYDFKMQMKQMEMEKLKMEKQLELKQMEEEEVARLRKESVYKANPIRHYKEVIIRPGNKSLTFPISPKSFSQQSKLSPAPP